MMSMELRVEGGSGTNRAEALPLVMLRVSFWIP